MITASFNFPRGFCFNKLNCQLKNRADTDEGRTRLARFLVASIWLFPPCNIWNSPRGSEGDRSGSALLTWKWAIVKVLPSTSPKKLTVFTVQHQLLHRKSCWWMTRDGRHDTQTMRWNQTKRRSSAVLPSSLLVSCSSVTFSFSSSSNLTTNAPTLIPNNSTDA